MDAGEKSSNVSGWRTRFNAFMVVILVVLSLTEFNLLNSQITLFLKNPVFLSSTIGTAIGSNGSTAQEILVRDNILHNLHLAMLGDSIMRYQYLNLAYYIHTGKWEDSNQTPSLAREYDFESWIHFYNYSNSIFEGNEGCDCYRAQGSPRAGQIFENRYYRTNDNTTSVAFVNRMGGTPPRGHATADTIHNARMMAQYEPEVWVEDTWQGLLENFISKLRPKPEFFVFNEGLWSDHDLTNETIFLDIRKALDDLGITGIYKTTTRHRYDRHEGMSAHDVFGCQHIHYCLNMSWTGSIDRSEYWDMGHFNPGANRRSNEALFDLLRKIRMDQQQEQQI